LKHIPFAGDPASAALPLDGRVFNEWLRARLRARGMSQRQLAERSGVAHSTISRMVRGDRVPSLTTAYKLAAALRDLPLEGDPGLTARSMSSGANPTRDVEHALRADIALNEGQVRRVMRLYLAERSRQQLGARGTGPPVGKVTAGPAVRGDRPGRGDRKGRVAG
jgi:transcriptional regulator with XRE-family HTH domain